jgi:transcriptional regulator with XRE-family HTH domain
MNKTAASNNPDINARIGERVHRLRTTKGWTMEALGDRLGVSFQQIQKYERGLNSLSPAKLVTLSRIFAVPVSYFFKQPTALERTMVAEAGFIHLIGRLRLIAQERPEAFAAIHAIVRVLSNEIRGTRPNPRPHRRRKAD